MQEEPTVVPDTKDWTWVLSRPCPDCGLDASAVAGADVGAMTRANATAWQQVLQRPDVRDRPAPGVWSPLEYACHVRDVHRRFDGRLAQMLAEAADVVASRFDSVPGPQWGGPPDAATAPPSPP